MTSIYIMCQFIASMEKMEPLQACMVTIILATVLKTAESCSGSKDFTFYDLKNPDAQQTCKRCQTCPPGQGLVKQCGSKVPYGTFTGCKPCVYNETYSEKKDTSHCKPCNRCGLRTVLQRCTPWQNSRCAATCRSGYIMDPVVDECKVVPENKTAASPLTSRNSTDEPSGTIASSDTKSPGTTSPTVSTYGITATNSTPANSSIRVRSTPLEDNQSTGQDSKNFKKTKIIVGSTCGAVFTILAAYFGIRKCRRKLNIHNFEHHDKSGNILEMKEQLPPMGRPPRKYHSQACDKMRRPLLGDQSNTNSNASSSENLPGNITNEVCAHKNGKLDVQQIPEDYNYLLREILNVHVMDELAGQLDQPGYPRVSYWIHLASEFQVPEDVIMKCQHSFESSPSKHMLECKEGFDTNFSVQALKKGLRTISRNDLVQKVDSCRLPTSATLREFREKNPTIFESICLQMDHHNNWKALGLSISIPDETLQQIATSTSCAKTVFDIIEKKNPRLTVKEMRNVLKEMLREDVCKVLEKYLLDSHTVVNLRENINCSEEVAILLDKETPGMKNWLHFAHKLGVSKEDCDNLKPKGNPSPTKALVEHIIQVDPGLKVKTFIEALVKMQRIDVVNALGKFICAKQTSDRAEH